MRNDPVQQRMVDANEIPRNQIQRARIEASRFGNTAPIPGKVVAELMFGFWTYLTSKPMKKLYGYPIFIRLIPAKQIEGKSIKLFTNCESSGTG